MTTLVNPRAIPATVRAIGYVRVSTERQAGETLTSLADQEAAIVALATRLGVTIGAWYRDEGASGATVEQRPAFRALLAACAAAPKPPRTHGYVLVLNDSRFGRFPDPDQAAHVRFQLKQSGWLVRFAESDDVEDPTFRPVIRALGAAQASEYRRQLQRNTRRGMTGAASQGFWTREAPYGYRRVVVYPSENARVLAVGQYKAPMEKVKLTPHEGEAAVVRWLFATYASGTVSLGDLVRAMQAKVPDRLWRRRQVHVILTNPTYTGDVVTGRRPAEDTERGIFQPRPAADWRVVPDAHPALVDRAHFADVQARLAANRGHARHSRAPYVLSGLVACATCDRPMTGGGGRTRPSGGLYAFYKCSRDDRPEALGYPSCPGPMTTVSRPLLEVAVVGTIARELARPAMRARVVAAIDEALTRLASPDADERAALAAQIAGLEAKRDRLAAAIADGTLTRAEAATPLATVRADLARVQARQAHAKFAAQRVAVAAAERERLIALALDFPRQARTLVGAELRELIRPWLARATFDKASRLLTMHIRRVPAVGALGTPDDGGDSVPVSHSPGPTGRGQVIVRRVDLSTPQFRATQAKRAAGGTP